MADRIAVNITLPNFPSEIEGLGKMPSIYGGHGTFKLRSFFKLANPYTWKESSDMALPVVGIGFMYSQGYAQQVMGSGWMANGTP